MKVPQFVHSLSSFQFLMTMEKVAKNIYIQDFAWTLVFIQFTWANELDD
jgi:hypothetical protein